MGVWISKPHYVCTENARLDLIKLHAMTRLHLWVDQAWHLLEGTLPYLGQTWHLLEGTLPYLGQTLHLLEGTLLYLDQTWLLLEGTLAYRWPGTPILQVVSTMVYIRR